MRLGIMQPYFFPYLGYFSLIKYSERFVFFDTPQYISHGWVNRNRILKPDGTPGYITVPIQKAKQTATIEEILISENSDWKEKIYGQLTSYKRKAPRYNDTIEFLHSILDKDYHNSLSVLNIETTKEVCNYLGIQRQFDTFSEMNLNIDDVKMPDEWALNITKALGGDIYVNPPGGQSFFDKNKYTANNIELQFLKSNLKPYIQRIGRFEPGLSVIDAMMFCNPEEINDILDDFVIIK